jgi:hypothetical protein
MRKWPRKYRVGGAVVRGTLNREPDDTSAALEAQVVVAD